MKLEQPSKRTTTTARSTCVAHSVAFDDKAERAPRGAGSPRAQRGSERQRRALDPGERAAIVEDTSNAEKLCRGSRMNRAGDMRSLALEAEVFGLHPLNLAFAFDDDQHIVFLVTKHCVSNTLGEGAVDSLLVLSQNASDVFARVSLHAAPCRVTVSQTSLS